ncbi:MAG TPA: hypothetical protein VFS33_03055 [Gemmatimonadales bacterium]|nr:hypothetical protein [Gemmatimonadales bacterium]
MRTRSWPWLALLALVASCGREPRSLDAGWFGTRTPAAAAATPEPTASTHDSATPHVSSVVHGRALPADAPAKVTLGGTRHAGTIDLNRANRSSKRPMPPADLKASLYRLRALQSNLYALGRTYTESPGELGYSPDPGVDLKIVWASNWGWAAIARDEDRPYLVCTMYVGAVPHEGAAAGRIDDAKAGVPNCMPSAESPGWRGSYPQLLVADSARWSLARGAATLMRHDLVKLIRSQRTNRALQGVYARHIAPMSLHYAWHPGVTLRILSADAVGWAAEATYDQVPGHSCVIWGGTVAQKPATAGAGNVAEEEGVPVCDD